jgi:rod shape-determining protein MreC
VYTGNWKLRIMENLLKLFLKLSGLFLFVLLEVVCFSLIVKYNQKQSEIYYHTENRLNGWWKEKMAASRAFFNLSQEDSLSKRNAALLQKLVNLKVDTLRQGIDTVYTDSLRPQYLVVEARVINNSVNREHNYLTLDKGKKDGILPNSGVITEKGVIGIVREVSNSYAVVMSLLHRQSKISARIKTKHYFGSLVWKSSNRSQFNLEDIPKHAPIVQGDTVETSGYSAIFPEGIPIGRVEKFWIEPGSNFYTVEVRASQDLSNIRYVYVITNLLREEQIQLEKAVLKEDE